MGPLIALSLILAGFCEAQKYAVRNLPSSYRESATLTETFFGTYGNGLSLLTELPTDLPNSCVVDTLKLATVPHRLHVFEFYAGANNGVSEVEKYIQAFPSAEIIFTSSTETVVQVLDVSFKFEMSKNVRSQFPTIENIIPVSTLPHRLPYRGSFPKVTAPDPKIQAAIGYVTQDSLRSTIQTLSDINTRQAASAGAREAQAWLRGQFLLQNLTVRTEPFNTNYSENVIATFAGLVSYPVVIMGAHYDSRSTNLSSTTQRAPGAVDNGSGTAALVELAKVLRLSGIRTRYPIVAIAFSAEEQGLLGSIANARTWNSGDIVGMFNADMLGYRLPGSPITLGFKDRYVTPELTASCVGITNTYVPSLRTANSSSCCSDYRSYWEAGFPAVGFFENQGAASDYPYYHTSQDLPEWIDWTQQQQETQAVIASVLTYAEVQ